MKRLATCFGQDFSEVQAQLLQLQPIAQKYRDEGHNNLESWRLALQAVSDRRIRQNFKIGALRQVLIRYASFTGCTTQGQEGSFSVQTSLLRPRRNHMLPSQERTELKISLDVNKENKDKVIKLGQVIYAQLYGSIHVSPKQRADKAVRKKGKRQHKAAILFESSTLRRRVEFSITDS